MRELYRSTEIPRYLDATARTLLAEGRAAFHASGHAEHRIFGWGPETVLFPWRGDRIMNTLAAVLASNGLAVGQDGLAITVSNCSPATLWELIRELVSDGTTVLLTTQYLEEADRLSDRIAVVDGGHVIANDTPDRLKSQLGSTVVEMQVEGADRAERAEKVLAGKISGRVEREGGMIRISSDEGAKVLIGALRALDGDGLSPDGLTVREPSLDDVFLSITGHHAEDDAEQEPAAAARRRSGSPRHRRSW